MKSSPPFLTSPGPFGPIKSAPAILMSSRMGIPSSACRGEPEETGDQRRQQCSPERSGRSGRGHRRRVLSRAEHAPGSGSRGGATPDQPGWAPGVPPLAVEYADTSKTSRGWPTRSKTFSTPARASSGWSASPAHGGLRSINPASRCMAGQRLPSGGELYMPQVPASSAL